MYNSNNKYYICFFFSLPIGNGIVSNHHSTKLNNNIFLLTIRPKEMYGLESRLLK
jgi:hypothetical protein